MLHDKYLFPKQDADALASFLGPMLRLHPDRRAKASDLIHHNFLDGTVVQGEIDVIRRMEQEEAEKRKQQEVSENPSVTVSLVGLNSRGTSREKTVSALDQSVRDAMKPVEGSTLIDEDETIVDDNGARSVGETRPTVQQYHQPPLLHVAPQQRASQHKKLSSGGQNSPMWP